MRRSFALRAAVTATVAVAFAASLAACGTGTVSEAKTPEPIHLGAIYDLTGSQSALDSPSLDGARLAVDRINAAGGLLGRRVVLLERDGQTDTATVRADAVGLAADKVSAMIGLSDTTQVLAAAPVAARAGIPFVTSGATSPLLPKQVPDWLFLAGFGDNVQAAAAAEYAVDRLGVRRAAILYDRDLDYTRLLKKYFAEAFAAYGGTVVFVRSFHSGERDISAVLQRAAAGGDDKGDAGTTPIHAQLIYLAAGPADAGPLVRKLRAAGQPQPIMGGDSFDNASLIAAASAAGGQVYYTTHAALGLANSTPAMRRFTAMYREAYGRTPENAFAGLGYDAVNLVAKAIRRAKSADPAKVRDALQKTRAFAGVTGALSYAGNQHVPTKQVTIIRVDRTAQLVAELVPAFVPAP